MQEEKDKPFECSTCGNKFTLINSLRRHKKQIHQDTSTTTVGIGKKKNKSSKKKANSPLQVCSKPVPKIITQLSLQEQEEDVAVIFVGKDVGKMISSTLVSNNADEVPPRGESSIAEEKPQVRKS